MAGALVIGLGLCTVQCSGSGTEAKSWRCYGYDSNGNFTSGTAADHCECFYDTAGHSDPGWVDDCGQLTGGSWDCCRNVPSDHSCSCFNLAYTGQTCDASQGVTVVDHCPN